MRKRTGSVPACSPGLHLLCILLVSSLLSSSCLLVPKIKRLYALLQTSLGLHPGSSCPSASDLGSAGPAPCCWPRGNSLCLRVPVSTVLPQPPQSPAHWLCPPRGKLCEACTVPSPFLQRGKCFILVLPHVAATGHVRLLAQCGWRD